VPSISGSTLFIRFLQSFGASTAEPYAMVQPCSTPCAGSHDLGLFGHWNISVSAGRQGGHITSVHQPCSPASRGCNKSTGQYIKCPHTAEEQVTVKKGFYCIADLSNTIGAINGTHLHVKAPSPDPFPHLNCKQYHAINIQLICNSQNLLINVVSRFSGGAQDSFILQSSSVGKHLE